MAAGRELDITLLWIPVTLVAAAAQVARTAMQHRLTEVLGTAGATQVRFLYGFPFACLFLVGVAAWSGQVPPGPDLDFLVIVTGGAVAQVAATAAMLAAMRMRSFAVSIAYTKTEPAQVAVFGILFLGDHIGWIGAAAILISTVGVVLISKARQSGVVGWPGMKSVALGLGAGAGFAIAAVAYRGAILNLGEGSELMRATTTLVWALGVQTLLLAFWMGLFDRRGLFGSLRIWRSSMFAGFMGALASQFWFFGFALTTAANVRTLGLVEVLFAAVVSRRILAQEVSVREVVGMALVVGGLALLLSRSVG